MRRGYLLARFWAHWSDGSTLVLHAHSLPDARALAVKLTPAGLAVEHVEAFRDPVRRRRHRRKLEAA